MCPAHNRPEAAPATDLPLWDPRKALEYPPIYNLFQRAVRADRPRRQFIEEHVVPLGGARVLEVGCGPGTNCAWLPDFIEYVGCDLSPAYIDYARRRYPQHQFLVAPVGEMQSLDLKPFRAVVALALLHHLTDEQVLALCDEVASVLDTGGVFMTGDPCFTSTQGRLERFLTSKDRGRHVRYPDEYRALVATRFPVLEMQVNASRGMLIPNTSVVLKASLGGG